MMLSAESIHDWGFFDPILVKAGRGAKTWSNGKVFEYSLRKDWFRVWVPVTSYFISCCWYVITILTNILDLHLLTISSVKLKMCGESSDM